MINRLPKEFRLPTTNGVKHGRTSGSNQSDLPTRVAAAAGRYIGVYPIAALGAAFVMGLITGRVVKR